MSNDDQSAEDVNRWYYGGTAPEVYRHDGTWNEEAIGYEAAHPALQAMHWPDETWPAAAVNP